MQLLRTLCLSLVMAVSLPALAQQISVSQLEGNNTSAVQGSDNGNARPASTSKIPIRSLLYPGATTKIFTRLMLWWGDKKHVNMGYRSEDPREIARQVSDMQSRGIDGTIVAWYGPGETPRNRALNELLRDAQQNDFLVAVSVDVGAVQDCVKHGCDETAEVASLVNYVVKNYATSSAYWRWRGRPVITFFGLERHNIDWHRVRSQVQGEPLFIFRNSGAFNAPESDGGFAWVAAETVKGSDQIAEEYLERFYSRAKQSGDKLTIGAAYKGFNDSLASWGKGKHMDQRCGETWLDTFAVINHNYSSHHQLDALIIPTWNDYEEGTAIEPGIASCVRIRAELHGTKLHWDADGPRDTIDHFSIYSVSPNGIATLVREVKNNEHDVSLNSASGSYLVEAVGRPSIQNVFSNVVNATGNDERRP